MEQRKLFDRDDIRTGCHAIRHDRHGINTPLVVPKIQEKQDVQHSADYRSYATSHRVATKIRESRNTNHQEEEKDFIRRRQTTRQPTRDDTDQDRRNEMTINVLHTFLIYVFCIGVGANVMGF